MQKVIELITENNGRINFQLGQIPDKCPICNNGIQPHIYFGSFSDISKPHSDYDTQVIFQCPMIKCQSMFIGYYQSAFFANGVVEFVLQKTAPFELYDFKFNDTINNISPSFVEIYNQAHKAEKMGWLQVAGPGFRKSLEYLIKDYCSGKAKTAEEIEDIKKAFLGPAIEKYVDNSRIKEIARRAAWIGNDETHYVRKWETKDIEDLIKLIEIAIYWIDYEKLSSQYIEEMPKEKK